MKATDVRGHCVRKNINVKEFLAAFFSYLKIPINFRDFY